MAMPVVHRHDLRALLLPAAVEQADWQHDYGALDLVITVAATHTLFLP
jgi:hypothetical protein